MASSMFMQFQQKIQLENVCSELRTPGGGVSICRAAEIFEMGASLDSGIAASSSSVANILRVNGEVLFLAPYDRKGSFDRPMPPVRFEATWTGRDLRKYCLVILRLMRYAGILCRKLKPRVL